MSIPFFIIGYRPLTFDGYRPLTFVRRQVDCAIPICVFDAWHNLSAAGRLHHSDMCFQHISATSIVSPPHIRSAAGRLHHSDMCFQHIGATSIVSPPHIRSAADRLHHSDMCFQHIGATSRIPYLCYQLFSLPCPLILEWS